MGKETRTWGTYLPISTYRSQTDGLSTTLAIRKAKHTKQVVMRGRKPFVESDSAIYNNTTETMYTVRCLFDVHVKQKPI